MEHDLKKLTAQVRHRKKKLTSSLLLRQRFYVFFFRDQRKTLNVDRELNSSFTKENTFQQPGPGLSLRGGGRGFPPATKNVAPGHFHRKIEEK